MSIMKAIRLAAPLATLLAWALPASAQTSQYAYVVTSCGTLPAAYTASTVAKPQYGAIVVDINGNLCGGVTISGGTITATQYATTSSASITRPTNTTTYTTNTGWNNGTPTFFSFTAACSKNGGQILVPAIHIWSSNNPTTKLQGILWLFAGVPGTNVSDNATFNIAAADYALLTGTFAGFAFTLANNQASGAANSGADLVGTTYQAHCAGGSTTITGMVQVVNAYVPANAEVLSVVLDITGLN